MEKNVQDEGLIPKHGDLGALAVQPSSKYTNRQDAKCAKKEELMREPGKEIDDLANAVIGVAIEVHRVLGPGYLESVYEEAMVVELGLRGIGFERQKSIHVEYKGRAVGEGRLDLLVGGRLIVELKAIEALAPIHTAQVLSYLKTLGLPLGLLINFNVPLLMHGIKRIVLSSNLGALGDLAVQPCSRYNNRQDAKSAKEKGK
jgi:GxxExxY protein